MTKSARFWSWIAPRYSRKPMADMESYRTKLAITQRHFHRDMEVLELGCGTGGTAVEHAPHVAHIRAVDISPRMIEIARKRASEAGIENVDFEVSDIGELELDDESQDAVLLLGLLHLVDDRDRLLQRVAHTLKPGGLIVSSTACMRDGANWIRPMVAVGHALGLLPMVCLFSREELRESMIRAGFEIEHEWQPEGKNKAVFIIARKPDGDATG
ncbi:MAG: class I SAM-dependent methyltransferase [Wenzhouxiangellaceae bacterium]|nr:class I SAM-dependent methyltransferase [Wenzhouxiangellaceae bacterium]